MTTNSSTGKPLRVMFVITSMPVGGAEVLLVNLVRNLDRSRIDPMICCLKEAGELGETIQKEIPVFTNLISYKFDVAVMARLRRLFKQQKVDAVITVGAGDKMFWGRLAARYARVPVVLSALHSTGWPDGVGKLNRLLTRITDGFIAVAGDHKDFLIEFENFPSEKVFMIPNGIETSRFKRDHLARMEWRAKLKIGSDDPVCGIVAALRSEKNHTLFLDLAEKCGLQLSNAHFLIVGDGPERERLEAQALESAVSERVHFLGTCGDIPGILSAMDLFALTSHNEASPVSILEAMSCGLPVVAPDVGSISQAVIAGKTGFLFETGDHENALHHWMSLLTEQGVAAEFGQNGREHVCEYGSLEAMTEGYSKLVEDLWKRKRSICIPPEAPSPENVSVGR